MKTIKIIDLLNKIANGEETPHFKINEDEYYLGADGLLKDVYGDAVEWVIYQKWLNEEVEIIEETKEIQKLINRKFTRNQKQIAGKINELIDAVNELKRGN